MATATRNPTSDEAVSVTWSGVAGIRYLTVNDYPDSLGLTFLTHGTTAGNLTFGFSVFSIPAGSTNISILGRWYDRKNAAQNCNIGLRAKVGGNYYNGGSFSPVNGTWTPRTSASISTNPKTGVAWTVDDINGVGSNALEAFGWFSTDANPAIDLSSIQIEVTYTPAGKAFSAISIIG